MNDNELRITKIFPYGDRMAEVSHSEGMTRVALDFDHFEEDCVTINAAGYEFIEAELKRKTGCDEVNWAN